MEMPVSANTSGGDLYDMNRAGYDQGYTQQEVEGEHLKLSGLRNQFLFVVNATSSQNCILKSHIQDDGDLVRFGMFRLFSFEMLFKIRTIQHLNNFRPLKSELVLQ